jgi:hypothetical protein
VLEKGRSPEPLSFSVQPREARWRRRDPTVRDKKKRQRKNYRQIIGHGGKRITYDPRALFGRKRTVPIILKPGSVESVPDARLDCVPAGWARARHSRQSAVQQRTRLVCRL